MFDYFECCHVCVPPKRYPGCSGKCPEYKEARAKFDEDNSRHRLERAVQTYTNTAICDKRDTRAKYLKGNRRYTRRG